MQRKKGFTLIELLVVIAIIAILAAILFPVFATARARARQASCLSNVKQLGLAYLMYMDDWDGAFPLFCGPEFDNPTAPSGVSYTNWMEAVTLYVKNKQLWKCPDAGYEIDWWHNTSGWMYWMAGYAVVFSHSVNCWSTLGKTGAVPNPAGQVMICDGETSPDGCQVGLQDANGGFADFPTSSVGQGCIYCPVGYPNGGCGQVIIGDPAKYPDYPAPGWGIAARHNGGGNYCFIDGHAKWLKAKAAVSQKPDIWGHADNGAAGGV